MSIYISASLDLIYSFAIDVFAKLYIPVTSPNFSYDIKNHKSKGKIS